MSKISERLDNEGEIPDLQEPEDPDNPDPNKAPFELKEARPLSQALGDYLTVDTRVGEDANPDVVLHYKKSPELTAWITRYRSSHGVAYVLTCWGWDHQMYFEVPKETIVDVIEQTSESPYWTFDIPDDELLENFIEAL